MEFRILGPLEVLEDGRPLALGRLKERTVLAVLLLHANEFVSRERLIDDVWGDAPPATARKAVNVYVSKLRKTLGGKGHDPIATADGGYRLALDPDLLDADRVRSLVAAARERMVGGESEAASRLLQEALAFWRGPTLAGLALESVGRDEVAQLDELRLTVLMDRIDCDLAQGRHEQVLGELQVLVREHPLRERLRAQQMLALYRADRQADALDVYQRTRQLLVEELGIEPSSVLQRLHKGILRQDPALEAPSGTTAKSRAASPELGFDETRKTVTALVCDLAGLVTGEVDVETRRWLASQYAEEVVRVLKQHGATLTPMLGEAVLAIFGHPTVHEDDAVRAVRAADAVLARIAARDRGNGRRSAVGIGIHTGEVVTDSETEGPSLASGTVARVAARLEQAAQPGEVLLAEATATLVARMVTLEPAAPLRLKGTREPVAAYRLLATLPPPNGRQEAAFVGRTAELALLRTAWERAGRERCCELFTLVGEAGIGKSRLAREFLAALDATVVTGRCLDYGEGVTYSPVVEVVRQLAARPSEPAAAAAIDSLLGATKSAGAADEIAWAFRKLLQEVAAEQPLVCVFDDLQWAGETILDLVEHVALLFSGAPMLVLCLARSEFAQRRAGWPITLTLEPLPDDEVDRLIPATIGDELRGRIAAAAAGNALFVVEMVAIAGEAGAAVTVPPSLRALLAARLEQLEPAERRILERAAVEGELFHRGAVQALGADEPQLGSSLAALVRKDFVRPDRPQVAGEEAFRFRHLLIRDAAYDSITKATRAELHERFAGWLEQQRSDTAELDELIGHHLERAARYKHELGQRDEELETRAGHRFAAAGRRARAQRNAAAVGLLSRALSLLPAPSELHAPLLIELAFAHGYARNYGAELERLEEAIEEAEKQGDRVSATWALLQRSFIRMHVDSDYSAQQALAEGRRGRETLTELGDARGVAYSWGLINYAHAFRGEHIHHLQGLELAVEVGDEWLQAAFRYAAAAASFYGPTPLEQVIPQLEQHLDAPGGRADDYHLLLAQAYAMQGRWPEAHAAVTAGTTWLRELGNEDEILVSGGRVLGEVELLAGEAAAAERHLRPCLRLLEERGEIFMSSAVATRLGAAMLAQGRYAEAIRFAHLSKTYAASDNRFAQVHWRATYARVLARAEREAKGERFAREAIAHAERTDNPNLLADTYAALADVLRRRERAAEAAVAAEKASSLYLDKGNVAAAERLLEHPAG